MNQETSTTPEKTPFSDHLPSHDGDSATALLRLQDVVCSFGGLVAVDHCSFDVQEGSITGLIGPNGAGKSTVFNLISGTVPLDNGRILFDGARIDGIPPHSIARRGIARTFQIPGELSRMTTQENLALVPEDQPGESMFNTIFMPLKVKRYEHEVHSKARDMLQLLNLRHLHDELAGNLSTGQKKLLELGRALMSNPRLVLLDEPGAGVNPTLMRSLVDSIQQLRDEQNVTFLIVEHDVPLIMDICDTIIVMAEGRVIAIGEPDDIRHNPDVLDAYLGGVDM